MSPRLATALLRSPLARLAALAGLLVAATAALSFQLGAARAYDAVGRRLAFAAEQPVLVARASLLAQLAVSMRADAEERVRAREELGRLLDQIEAGHQALVLMTDVEQWEGAAAAPAATALIGEVDAALDAFLADGRALVAAGERGLADGPEARSRLSEPGVARLADRFERIASAYVERQRDIVRRRARLAWIAWIGVMVSAVAVGATQLLWRRAAAEDEAAREGALTAPRYAFIGRYQTAAPAASGAAAKPVGAHALVCVREHGLREAVRDRLHALGLDVESVATLDEARHAIGTRTYGLFVVDSAGAVLARRLKAAASPARAACVAIASASEDARALRALGADVVIARPLQPMELETAAAFATGALPMRKVA